MSVEKKYRFEIGNSRALFCPTVLFMLLQCCVHAAFQTFQAPSFPRFSRPCACCFHVVSILLSERFQEPCVFPGFCAYCFHVVPMLLAKTWRTWCFPIVLRTKVFAHFAFITFEELGVFRRFCAWGFHVVSMLLSKPFQEPGVFPGFRACCFHVLSMLSSKTCQEPGVFSRFCACSFMLCPYYFPKRFKKLVFYQAFVHVVFMLCPGWFPKNFKNLVFSQVFVYIAFMLYPWYLHVMSVLFSKTLEPGVLDISFMGTATVFSKIWFHQGFVYIVFMLCPCCQSVSRTSCFPTILCTKFLYCVHGVSQNVSRSWCFPRFLYLVVWFFFYVISILSFKIFQKPGVFHSFYIWLRTLFSWCIYIIFQNISRSWYFPRSLCLLVSYCIQKNFSNNFMNLVFSPPPSICAWYFQFISIVISKTYQNLVFCYIFQSGSIT